MRRNENHRFLYSASAVAVSGVLHQPYSSRLPPYPSIALDPIGGAGCQEAENISFRDANCRSVLRIGRAVVRVAGGKRGNHYSTSITAAVEELNILDIVTADRIVSNIFSSCVDEDHATSTLYFTGSHFDNLKIEGRLYQPDLTEAFRNQNGFRAVKDTVESRPFLALREEERAIIIPEFGSIYLGEIFFVHGLARLTMLRVELGCSYEGELACASTSNNGHRIPP
ncbi:MAG: hypothetical protein JOZ45_02630 [Acidobacteriaceae bacterium]|nr:hypothetical protein [Acidobacteriaceae bacterium]MBV9305004.1 hypothetical protein [Acidobacteriaceae bacterium]